MEPIQALPGNLWKAPAAGTRRSSRRIVAIGQLSVDTIVHLDREFLPGGQTTGRYANSIGGTAAIVAHNAAVLGGRSTFIGHTGTSPEDRAAIDAIRSAGVMIGSVVTTPMGLRVTVVVDPSGERSMISNRTEPDWSHLQLDVDHGDLVAFEGWHLFSDTARNAYSNLIRSASAAGATIVLDVCNASRSMSARTHRRLLGSLPVDVLLGNEAEAHRFGLLEGTVAPIVIVHRGTRSTIVARSGVVSEHHFEPTIAYDTCGAGDTFAAGLLVGLSQGFGLTSAVHFGHRAAARVLSADGAMLPDVTRRTMAQNRVA